MQAVSAAACVGLFETIIKTAAAMPALRGAALQALGAVLAARPDNLKEASCQKLLSEVLKSTAGHAMNRTALLILMDLLKADEEQLEVDQTLKEQQQSKGRKEAKSKRKAEAIPTQNGEQDSMSISSGIVQVNIKHWDEVQQQICDHLNTLKKHTYLAMFIMPFMVHIFGAPNASPRG